MQHHVKLLVVDLRLITIGILFLLSAKNISSEEGGGSSPFPPPAPSSLTAAPTTRYPTQQPTAVERTAAPPLVGGVTAVSAVVGFRTDGASSVEIEYDTDALFSSNSSRTTAAVVTLAEDDFTGSIELSDLSPDTLFHYRLVVDGVTSNTTQQFKTLTMDSKKCKLMFFADVRTVDAPASVYSNAALEAPDLVFQIGDLDHGGPTNLEAARALHYKMRNPSLAHGHDFSTHILSKFPLDHVWDDFDYCGQDSDGSCPFRSDAIKAYKEYYPGYTLPENNTGIWHKLTCGGNNHSTEVFVLDTRSQRDPTSNPPTMLGSVQKQWLKDGLLHSTATWKIVITSVSAHAHIRPSSTDQWRGGFAEEAAEMRDFLIHHKNNNGILHQNSGAVVLVSGDLHSGGGIDTGASILWGTPELAVPHTNVVDFRAGHLTAIGSGHWDVGIVSGIDNPGYAIVEIGGVDGETLTLEAKGSYENVRLNLTIQAVQVG